MELGVSTFAETTPDPATGEVMGHGQRLREVVEEAVVAEESGLDVYAVGEHHRDDFAASAPAVVLAAIAARTSTIRLSSAVTVLSSEDPVRVYQQFATLDQLSGGRAEIIAGRGSFTESFPLFGQDLADYDELFAEKLDLLLAVRASERVTWSGRFRPALHDAAVYPRALQDPLPVWIGVGGSPQSVVRAGLLGLPLTLAIIGGLPEQFAPLTDLYRRAAERGGHDVGSLGVAVNVHGFIAPTRERAMELLAGPYLALMGRIGRERGWPPMTRAQLEAGASLRGALYVGDPEQVAEKIVLGARTLGATRILVHVSPGTMPHRDVLRAIELLGTVVAPLVRKELDG